jgi:hypothetical protein
MYTTCLKSQTISEKCSKYQQNSVVDSPFIAIFKRLKKRQLNLFSLFAQVSNRCEWIKDYSQEYIGEVSNKTRRTINKAAGELAALGLIEKRVAGPTVSKSRVKWATAEYRLNPDLITNLNLRESLSGIISAFKTVPLYLGSLFAISAFNRASSKKFSHNLFNERFQLDLDTLKAEFKQMVEEFSPTSEEIATFEGDWAGYHLDALRLSCAFVDSSAL